MQNIPEKHSKDDSKEIRLFGEKSIKEEAYRHKILDLEKEVMKLESILKSEHQKPDPKLENNTNIHENITMPEYSEGLFYEASASLETKFKKYQNMLEARGRHISDRLNIQAQNLIEHEKIQKHVINTKKAIIALALFVLLATALVVFNSFALFNLKGSLKQAKLTSINAYQPSDNLMNALQNSGFYKNQYTVISLNYHNKAYKGIAELHFRPHNNWTLKKISSDIIDNFKRLTRGQSLELNLMYEGDTYAKVDFTPVLGETHFDFKEK